MITMKNIIKYLLLPVVLVGFTACTNLDEELKDRYTENFDPSNPGVGIKNNVNKAQPNDGLQGAFSSLLGWHATNGGFFGIQELGTDEAVITQKGGDWYDGGAYIKVHKHEFTPQTWEINSVWSNAYGGIFKCNTLLGDAAISADAGKVAQLKTLRAYLYWILLDVFGNVKIVTVAGQDAPQATRQEVFDFVEAELLEAIADLPAGRHDYGRVSQAAAYGLLSRLYLNAEVYTGTQRYQDAIDAADAVLAMPEYVLSADFHSIFTPDNVDNSEHIFVIPFDESTGQNSFWSQMTLHYPSQLTYKLQQQPWNGFSTLEDFYNSFDDGDDRKAASFIAGPQYDLFGAPILDLAFDKADDGPEIIYTPEINELAPNASRQAGARFGKFSFKIGQSPNADNDFPIIRLGEIYLNKAEALCRLNNDWANGEAWDLIQVLRDRANAGAPAATTEGEFLAERGREMFVEEIRRTDRIRFGVYCEAYWEKPDDSANSDTHKLMAIPFDQIQAAATGSNPLTQNPGY